MIAYATGLLVLLAAGAGVWVLSLLKRDVSIVDILWGLFFVIAAFVYEATAGASTARETLVLILVTLWGVRLAGYITWRAWGEGEDRRYVAIRHRNNPGFQWKSLYMIFGFQALLAWIVSLPLYGAITSSNPLDALDLLGAGLCIAGIVFETTGDFQLARFKAREENKGRVMDRGLWRYTRHPNYFGDFCVWWGFFLIALSGGAWWSLPGPIVMSFLLLRFSGVALLENDLANRKPEYIDYINRTNTFFPGPRRSQPAHEEVRS